MHGVKVTEFRMYFQEFDNLPHPEVRISRVERLKDGAHKFVVLREVQSPAFVAQIRAVGPIVDTEALRILQEEGKKTLQSGPIHHRTPTRLEGLERGYFNLLAIRISGWTVVCHAVPLAQTRHVCAYDLVTSRRVDQAVIAPK
jgi:hypothetical protein